MSSINDLPADVFCEVVKYLGARDVSNLGQTCKPLHHACQNQRVWKLIAKRLGIETHNQPDGFDYGAQIKNQAEHLRDRLAELRNEMAHMGLDEYVDIESLILYENGEPDHFFDANKE